MSIILNLWIEEQSSIISTLLKNFKSSAYKRRSESMKQRPISLRFILVELSNYLVSRYVQLFLTRKFLIVSLNCWSTFLSFFIISSSSLWNAAYLMLLISPLFLQPSNRKLFAWYAHHKHGIVLLVTIHIHGELLHQT